MNSSGIKRGLAAGAISALAVTGLPFLASSANAAAGDVIQVASVGATLNGGQLGGVIVLKTKGITETEAETAGNLKLIGSDLKSDPNDASQTVAIEGAPVWTQSGSADDSNKTDGYDEVTLHVSATTAAVGDVAKYAVYLNDDPTAGVQASEPRAQVQQTTSGVLDKIVVSPDSQSTAQGIESGAYTASLQDAAGHATQLDSGQEVDLSTDAQITLDPNNGAGFENQGKLDATALELGSATFAATPSGTADTKAHQIDLASTTTNVVTAKATLNVTAAADVNAGQVDIVTGADSWDGFDHTDNGATAVRVDQSSVQIDIKGSTANGTVTLNLTGNGITFGGKGTSTVSTVLDKDGNGSLTITPDAGTVQENDSIGIDGSFVQTLTFKRSEPTAVKSAGKYFSALKGSVDVTATVVDQFGDPMTSGYVTAQREDGNTITNVNTDAAAQKKAVGSDGTVTFTFTDAKAANGDLDNVDFKYFVDQYATTAKAVGSTTIKYTTDGMGSDFKTWLGTADTEGTDYKASDVTVVPLADTDAGDADEYTALKVANGEKGSAITVSVDNGALIIPDNETALSKGKASITDTVDSTTGELTGYNIVGTKSGVVTVTITSAHRTETAQFTVAGENDQATERNVTVSGPAEVASGTNQITYTAVVTDAFGNPIPNVSVYDLNVQVTGPAQFQDSDATTNAAGQINLNVRVDSEAAGDVNIKVTGIPSQWLGGSQFGAAADHLYADSSTKDGEGLPVSSYIANATTTVDAAQPPVVDPAMPINLKLNGTSNGAKDDVLRANANSKAAGLVAKLYHKTANGWRKVASASLNANGNHKFKVADKNGNKATTYQVRVAKSADANTLGDKANKRVR